MIQLLQNLDPVRLQKNFIIFSELDYVNEIIFVEEGQYDIGYEVNKKI